MRQNSLLTYKLQAFEAKSRSVIVLSRQSISTMEPTLHVTTQGRLQVQTLQATRRKEEKLNKDTSLTVPLKRQTGLFADIAEVNYYGLSEILPSFCCSRQRLWLKEISDVKRERHASHLTLCALEMRSKMHFTKKLALLQIVSQNGWTGLYKGLKPSLLGTTVSQGIYFYLYSILRQAAVKLLQRQGKGRMGKFLNPVCQMCCLQGPFSLMPPQNDWESCQQAPHQLKDF